MCHSTRYAFFSCLNLEQDIKITLYGRGVFFLAHFDSEINGFDFSPILHPLWNHWRSIQSDRLCVIYSRITPFSVLNHIFFSAKKKRNTKTAQPNRFQILLKVTNQISGEMDVKKRPCPGWGGGGPCHPSYNVSCRCLLALVAYCRLCRHCCNLAKGGCLISLYALSLLLGHVSCRNLPWQGLNKVAIELCNFGRWNHFCTPLSSITSTNLWLLSIKLRWENIPPFCLITAIH